MKKMTHKTFLFAALLLTACSSQKTKDDSHFLVEIDNGLLKNAIADYASANKFDSKKHLVSVFCRDLGPMKKYFISMSASKTYQVSPPNYYAFEDDRLILVHVSDDESFKVQGINGELEQYIEEKQILLSDKIIANEIPTWVLSECDGHHWITKEIDVLNVEVLPCDYSLKRKELGSDSLILTRK